MSAWLELMEVAGQAEHGQAGLDLAALLRDQGVEVLHVVLHLELLGAVVLSVMPYRRLLVALFHPCRPR